MMMQRGLGGGQQRWISILLRETKMFSISSRYFSSSTSKPGSSILGTTAVSIRTFSSSSSSSSSSNDNRRPHRSNDNFNYRSIRPGNLNNPYNRNPRQPPGGGMYGGGRGGVVLTATTGIPGQRANTVILFPGDFSDNEKIKYNAFDDDDDSNINDNMGYIDEENDEEIKKERERLQQKIKKEQEQKQRWIENAKPINWQSIIDDRGRSYGRGARKRAQASVWIQPGYGEIIVNKRTYVDYFNRLHDRDLIIQPFIVTETCGKFDVQVHVKGGGLTGQAGAIRLGIARALNSYNPDLYRLPLKMFGYLQRDARKVERKKVGHKKARKSPQWVRR